MALDNFRTQKIIWDRANRKIFETIEANAGDSNGRKLVVQVINQETTESLSGTTLSLGWKSRKGAKGLDAFNAVDASKGIFEIYYTTEMLSNIGNLEASLILINSTGRIESSTFTISVRPSTVDDESVESENSFTALTEALAKANDLEDNYAPRLNEVTAQLAETAGLGNYTETPIYDSSNRLVEIRNSNGGETVLTYNSDGSLNSVIEPILGEYATSTLNYTDGNLVSVTRSMSNNTTVIYPSTLIASVDNYLVDFQVDKLVLSRDGGRTYTETLSIPEDLGIIKGVHVFDGGEILVMGHQKCYYSHDWKNFTESSVLDIDGNVFTPALYDNFTINRKNPHTQMINGKEIYCWINYSIHEDAQYKNINIWYTTDKGKTIKSCYRFRDIRDDVSNPNLFARHGHNVSFNPNDNTFWAMTGDFTTNGVMESHVLKGQYDSLNDSWSWELVGSGDNYKWTMIEFRGDYVYYTLDHSWGGVMRCLLSDIGDTSKHVKIIKTPNDTIGLYMSDKGDMLVTQSVYGGTEKPRIFYYSEDWGETFHTIEGDVPVNYDYQDACYYGFWAPNSEGKILSGVWSLSHEPLDQWDRVPSVFIDDSIRKAGFPNAFK